MDYRQPSFYRFNEDSLYLVHTVIDWAKGKKITKVADLCAGCGIIGIEFCLQHKDLKDLYLLEIQNEFRSAIEQNIQLLPDNIRTHIFYQALGHFEPQVEFDLILSNPPYFDAASMRKSPNFNKQMCRSFEVDSPCIFLQKIESLLTAKGAAFVLIPRGVQTWEKALQATKLKISSFRQLEHVIVYLFSKKDLN